MTDGWTETTDERTVTVSISEDSSVTRQEVIDVVSELFEDNGDGESNGVENTTDSETRTFERGYNK